MKRIGRREKKRKAKAREGTRRKGNEGMAAATAMAAVATSMASLSIKASSSVKDFSGLSSATSFACRLPAAAAAPSRSAGLLQAPLRIEARNPTRRESTKVRHRRIRKKLNGTSERPRLAVYRSNKHIYAQVIDDTISSTLAAASTAQKALRQELELSAGPTIEAAKRVGAEIAKACAEKGISKVAFDRGGFIYHGRIQALADAARENGLDF